MDVTSKSLFRRLDFVQQIFQQNCHCLEDIDFSFNSPYTLAFSQGILRTIILTKTQSHSSIRRLTMTLRDDSASRFDWVQSVFFIRFHGQMNVCFGIRLILETKPLNYAYITKPVYVSTPWRQTVRQKYCRRYNLPEFFDLPLIPNWNALQWIYILDILLNKWVFGFLNWCNLTLNQFSKRVFSSVFTEIIDRKSLT